MVRFAGVVFLLLSGVSFVWGQKDPFHVHALMGLQRISDPQLSPDGRWLAYTSSESGRRDVHISRFPEMDQKWQKSLE